MKAELPLHNWCLPSCLATFSSNGQCCSLLIGRIQPLCCAADFPLFEWDEDEQRLVAMHHPFTAANPEDMQASNGASLRTARALAYDLVYNGVEIAGKQPPAPLQQQLPNMSQLFAARVHAPNPLKQGVSDRYLISTLEQRYQAALRETSSSKLRKPGS